MSEKSVHQTRAVLALLLLALIWGYNWVVMKIALQYSTASQFAAMRTLGGGFVPAGADGADAQAAQAA